METVCCREPTRHSTQQGAMALPPQGPTVSRTTQTQTCASQSEPRKTHLGKTVAAHIDCFYMTVTNNPTGGLTCCGSLFQRRQPLIGMVSHRTIVHVEVARKPREGREIPAGDGSFPKLPLSHLTRTTVWVLPTVGRSSLEIPLYLRPSLHPSSG